MAFVHGKDSVFKLDNASGSLTDISTYVNNVDFPETADVAETSTLGASNKTYIVGLKDATISLGGLFDATVDAILGAAGLGDIGKYFPSESKKWENCNNIIILILSSIIKSI